MRINDSKRSCTAYVWSGFKRKKKCPIFSQSRWTRDGFGARLKASGPVERETWASRRGVIFGCLPVCQSAFFFISLYSFAFFIFFLLFFFLPVHFLLLCSTAAYSSVCLPVARPAGSSRKAAVGSINLPYRGFTYPILGPRATLELATTSRRGISERFVSLATAFPVWGCKK